MELSPPVAMLLQSANILPVFFVSDQLASSLHRTLHGRRILKGNQDQTYLAIAQARRLSSKSSLWMFRGCKVALLKGYLGKNVQRYLEARRNKECEPSSREGLEVVAWGMTRGCFKADRSVSF